jgi:hypothetical protein
VSGTFTVGQLLTNSGAIVVNNGGVLNATIAGISVRNNPTGTITVNAGGTVNDDLNNAGTVTNNGTYNATVAANTGTITNNNIWNGNVLSNTGLITNAGTWTTLSSGFNNAGTLTTTLMLDATNGGLTNTGTVNAQGTIKGAIANNAGNFNVTGLLTGNSTFVNAAGATTTIGGNSFTGLTSFNNAGTTAIAGGMLGATSIANTGTFVVTGSAGTLATASLVNNGTINLTGANQGSNLNANSAVLSGSGNVATNVNLNQGGTGVQSTLGVGSIAAGSNVNGVFNQTGGGATGVFDVVKVAGSNLGTVSQTGLHDSGLVHYQFLTGGAPGNPGKNDVIFGSPVAGAAIAPMTSILSAISSIDASFHQPGGALVASPQTDKTGLMVGGPWFRVSGGVTNILSTGTSTLNGALIDTVNSKTRVEFSGAQGGVDTGWLNLGNYGVNAHVGVTGGQIFATATEQTSAENQVKFSVPFVGLYGVLTRGQFSTDLTVRHSWYDMSVRNLSAGLVDGKFDGQSDNINGSVSYLIPFANNYFIEPTANLSFTRSTFNNLQVATGLAGSQMLTFNNVYSLLGRAGARVGTSFVYGGFNWTPFGVALVLNEFNRNAAGTFVAGASTPFGLETNRVGTFGQASAGIAMTSLTSGWLAFVRGDLKFGQRLDGAAVLGGARYTFGPM